MSGRRRAWLWVMGVLLFTAGEALAQVEIEEPTAGEKNAFGFSAIIGPNFTEDTYAYGASAEYDRLLTSKWVLALSIDAGWTPSEAGKIERGLSLTANGGYAFAERWSAEIAFSKEFARYGPDTSYGWKWANGDNAVGIGASYTLWEKARHSLDVSVGFERNLTASENSIGFELGYAFSF